MNNEDKCVKCSPSFALTLHQSMEVYWLIRQLPLISRDTANIIRNYLGYNSFSKVNWLMPSLCLIHNKKCHIAGCYNSTRM